METKFIELKKCFVHEDLFYHFLDKFPKNEWINLDKQELIDYIKDHIPSNAEKKESNNQYYSHEYYIVLSHVHNKVPWVRPSVHSMHIDDFRSWYNIAIQSLINHDIYSNDEILDKLYEDS